MTKLTRDSIKKRIFSDPKNYPYGFSRSGDFSINESKALAQYGCLVAALVDGEMEAESPEEEALLLVAFGKKEPGTPAEKAWVKYQKRINRPKAGSIYGAHSVTIEGDEDDIEQDDDIELKMDDE